MQRGKKTSSTTQGFLLISEIKADTIVTTDGGLRAVVAVSSTNFVLKSTEEQEAILARYQSFLNALDFPIQVLVRSRRLDIGNYLRKLREKEMQQANELLRVQTEEYIEYVGKLLEFGNIMSKTFYVIVPYAGSLVSTQGFAKKLSSIFNPGKEIYSSHEKFQQELRVLNERVGHIESSLSSMGLHIMRLNSQELTELLFHSYNLSNVETQILKVEDLQINN
ncbi:MAG: hypothetical protein M1275_03400 [Patescibacteria group bacterium]|nr:hypothetical protein [Patescibacteria group bacterium]